MCGFVKYVGMPTAICFLGIRANARCVFGMASQHLFGGFGGCDLQRGVGCRGLCIHAARCFLETGWPNDEHGTAVF